MLMDKLVIGKLPAEHDQKQEIIHNYQGILKGKPLQMFDLCAIWKTHYSGYQTNKGDKEIRQSGIL